MSDPTTPATDPREREPHEVETLRRLKLYAEGTATDPQAQTLAPLDEPSRPLFLNSCTHLQQTCAHRSRGPERMDRCISCVVDEAVCQLETLRAELADRTRERDAHAENLRRTYDNAVELNKYLGREIARAEARLADAEGALDESVKLQAHYAELLNMHDGGRRLVFKSSEEWMQRLSALRDQAAPPKEGATDV